MKKRQDESEQNQSQIDLVISELAISECACEKNQAFERKSP